MIVSSASFSEHGKEKLESSRDFDTESHEPNEPTRHHKLNHMRLPHVLPVTSEIDQ